MWMNKIIRQSHKAEGLKRAALRSAEAMGTMNRPRRGFTAASGPIILFITIMQI
jgi:hypothetical protein